jgi:hypothetical protein
MDKVNPLGKKQPAQAILVMKSKLHLMFYMLKEDFPLLTSHV